MASQLPISKLVLHEVGQTLRLARRERESARRRLQPFATCWPGCIWQYRSNREAGWSRRIGCSPWVQHGKRITLFGACFRSIRNIGSICSGCCWDAFASWPMTGRWRPPWNNSTICPPNCYRW